MEFKLIPFALHEMDGKIVDVADVAGGLACGCICPSCKSRLIARKGDIKVWHFAHASRVDGHQTQTDCDYSWVVSVRLMARQLLSDGLRLALPPVTATVEANDQWGLPVRHTFPVAQAQSVDIQRPLIDASFGGALVDVLAAVVEAPLVIYFTHGGRAVPVVLMAPPPPCAGVVSIELDQHALAQGQPSPTLGDRQRLAEFLKGHLPSKSWVYHRDAACQKLAELKALKARLSTQTRTTQPRTLRSQAPTPLRTTAQPRFTHIQAIPGEKAKFHCVGCEFRWGESLGGRHPCPRCGALSLTALLP